MTSPIDSQLAFCRSVCDADYDDRYFNAVDLWKILADIFSLAKTKHRSFLPSKRGKSIMLAFSAKHGRGLAIRSVGGMHSNWYYHLFCHAVFDHFNEKQPLAFVHWARTRVITSSPNDVVGDDGSVVVISDRPQDTAEPKDASQTRDALDDMREEWTRKFDAVSEKYDAAIADIASIKLELSSNIDLIATAHQSLRDDLTREVSRLNETACARAATSCSCLCFPLTLSGCGMSSFRRYLSAAFSRRYQNMAASV